VAEGVVIVVSILLAMRMEAWWSGVDARRAAREALASVQEELSQVQAQLRRAILWNTRAHAGATSIRNTLLSGAADADVSLPDTVLLTSLFSQVNDYPTSAIEAFVASGHPRELDNPELRRQLLAWPSRVGDLHDDELRAREVRNELSNRLGEAGADIGLAFTAETAGSRLFEAGPETAAQSSGVSLHLQATVPARNSSIGYSQILGILLLQGQSALAEADSLATLIDSHSR